MIRVADLAAARPSPAEGALGAGRARRHAAYIISDECT